MLCCWSIIASLNNGLISQYYQQNKRAILQTLKVYLDRRKRKGRDLDRRGIPCVDDKMGGKGFRGIR